MKKIYVVLVATILSSSYSFAQKGSNFIGLGGDLSMPTGYYADYSAPGIGLYGKAMLGVGKTGQVTFSTGYTTFKGKSPLEDFNVNISVIPLLFGYRFNMNGFFIEPQAGYGIYNFKYIEVDDEFVDATGAATWAANVGYVFNKQVEITARYQSGSRRGDKLEMFGLRLGYNFPIRISK